MRDAHLDLEASQAEPMRSEWDLFGAALSVGFGAIGTVLLVAVAFAWWLVQS